jgi:peroxiredoxin
MNLLTKYTVGKVSLLTLIAALALTGFSSFTSQTFMSVSALPEIKTISGFAHGYEDSTWLYLDQADHLGKPVDSVQIQDERFVFRLNLEQTSEPRQYAIRTKSFTDYKLFWIENASLTFSGVKGNFRNALIEGSVFQRHNESFDRLTLPLIIQIDSLQRNFGTTDSVIWKQILALEEELKQQSIAFIAAHRTHPAAAYLLSVYCRQWGRTTSVKLYDQLSVTARETGFGQKVKQFIQLNQDIQIGSLYADFSLPDPDGKPQRLSALRSKYTLLEFWASWCAPCRKENPNLVKQYQLYHARGFEIVGVSHDVSAAQWKKAIEQDKLAWPNLGALKGSEFDVALQYGVFEIPTNFLIDQQGRIIAKNLRGEELNRKLRQLFIEQ